MNTFVHILFAVPNLSTSDSEVIFKSDLCCLERTSFTFLDALPLLLSNNFPYYLPPLAKWAYKTTVASVLLAVLLLHREVPFSYPLLLVHHLM